MKKSFFITMLSLFVFSSLSMAQCISCYDNTVDTSANASAVGQHNTATGQASFAMGTESKALGFNAGAFGSNSEAVADGSFTIGTRIKSFATSAIVLGSGYNFTDYLINGTYNSLMIGFNSTAPTLFVSETQTNDTHKDRTGRVGIGNVTVPEAKLHIRSDDNESATLFLQPFNWSAQFDAAIWLGNKNNGISAAYNEGMVYNTENNHIFKGGDVYIENIDKGIIMKSPDGKCWRGTLNNSGSLQFIQLDACPPSSTTTYIPNKSGSNGELQVYPNPFELPDC